MGGRATKESCLFNGPHPGGSGPLRIWCIPQGFASPEGSQFLAFFIYFLKDLEELAGAVLKSQNASPWSPNLSVHPPVAR